MKEHIMDRNNNIQIIPRTATHAVLSLGYVLCLMYDIFMISDVGNPGFMTTFTYTGYGGKFKYLTFLCQILQPLYFCVSLLNDLFGSNLEPGENPIQRSPLHKFRDILFAGFAFPIGCFVSLTFWVLYAIDRHLVHPPELDAYIPQWLNHQMHTAPIVFVVAELFIVYHHYPSNLLGVTCCVSFATTYQIWMFWIAFYAGIWVYPILEVLNWPSRTAFLVTCNLFAVAFYYIGERTNNYYWGKSANLEGDKKKKRI